LQVTGGTTGGGLLSDTSGICQQAFAANFGVCTITHAEVRTSIIGLRIARDHGNKKVNLQVD
ncbi:hypothetical protein LINGRAHAP2_LOCUS6863, partial [Linum grandiflorum]